MAQINKITNKIVDSASKQLSKAKNVTNDAISSSTKEFINRLSNTGSEAIIEFLENNTKPVKIRNSNNKLYRYNNLLIQRTNGYTAEVLEDNIKRFQDSNFAPKFVHYFKLGNDDFITILEANTTKLLPYTPNADKISQVTKQTFIQRVNALVKRGYVNREIFANKDAMFVSADGNNIIFADWSEVSPLSAGQKSKLLEYVNNWKI